jgi:tRNA threonylcarbamoyl adenosine modification protein YeaZ
MNLLAIDTCGDLPSLALWQDGEMLTKVYWGEARQTAVLLPLLQALLTESGCQGEDLAAVAVTQGPGAFTSLRVGATLAQGLAYAWQKPLFSASTLATLAFAAAHASNLTALATTAAQATKAKAYERTFSVSLTPKPETSAIVVLQDARLHSVYAAVYGLDEKYLPVIIQEDSLWDYNAFADFPWPHAPALAVGSAFRAYPDLAARFAAEKLCEISFLAPALAALAAGQSEAWQSPLAFQAQYLREDVAQAAKN